MIATIPRLLAYRRAKPLDYPTDEIANADEPYLASMVRAALNGCDGVPHYEIGTGNAASVGGDAGGESCGSCWPFGSCHEDDR